VLGGAWTGPAGPGAGVGVVGPVDGVYPWPDDRHDRSVVRDRTAASRAPSGDGGSATMHSSLIGKVEKANRYARELDRITIDRLSLTFRGDNDTHHVSLDAGQWHCTCHYFESWSSCVHLLTLQKIMGVMLPEEAQVSIFSAQAVPSA
jgi:hypothetical protein